MNEIRQDIRPAPYYNVRNQAWEYTLMRQLRTEFTPKLKRRFPLFGQGSALFGLSRQVKPVNIDGARQSLAPTKGSPVSAVVAPLLLLPLWLQMRRTFDIQLLVYADDVLFFCKSQEVCGRVFIFLHNRLFQDYDLQLQAEKTQSGRFSENEVDYCGWNFKGGYSRISRVKTEAFKERLATETGRCPPNDISVFIKRVNRKIDGFGHYYKYGAVCKQFIALDVYIRALVRKSIARKYTKSRYDNKALQQLGLRSLEGIYQRKNKAVCVPVLAHYPVQKKQMENVPDGMQYMLLNKQIAQTERMGSQLQQLIRLQREQNRLLEQLLQPP
jgi:hypothetical protein